MKKLPDPNSLDYVIDRSGIAPKGNKDWSRSNIPGEWWRPAGITVDDGMLCWEPRFDTSRRVELTPDLLREFLTIAETDSWNQRNTRILRFARQWGPLHLCCEHLRPVWHKQDPQNSPPGDDGFPVCPPIIVADDRYAEPLWGWYLYALLVRDVVNASALARPKTARSPTDRERRIADMLLVKPQRDPLLARVQGLIEDGGGFAVLPAWPSDPEGSPPVWRAEVRTLAAALGVALWNTLCRSPGVSICVNCLELFEVHQWDQRYCRRDECQAERKRVEKAQLRAKQAAAVARDPDYAI